MNNSQTITRRSNTTNETGRLKQLKKLQTQLQTDLTNQESTNQKSTAHTSTYGDAHATENGTQEAGVKNNKGKFPWYLDKV